jgi:hypothetical protein
MPSLVQTMFIHPAVCHATRTYDLPKQVLHRVRSSASSFNIQYPLVFSRSPGSCLHLLPRLPVTPSLYLSFNNAIYMSVPTQYSHTIYRRTLWNGGNCFGQRNVRSILIFAGKAVEKHVNHVGIAYGPKKNRNSRPICRTQTTTTPDFSLFLH